MIADLIQSVMEQSRNRRKFDLDKIKQIAFLCIFCVYGRLVGQNLAPNPSFELYETCPPYPGQIHLAEEWDSPNNNTTDYFHRCAPDAQGASVPENLFGFQEPVEGDGYIGLRAWIPSGQSPVYREYLGGRLTKLLEAGRAYEVSFSISPGDLSTHFSDGLGAYFFSAIPENERIYAIQPHIRHPKGEIIRDTDVWIPIRGTYLAQGGEQYLMIGNFHTDEETLRVPADQTAGNSDMVYYYLDDVTVRPCLTLEAPLSLGVDTTLCMGDNLQINLPYQNAAFTWQDGSSSSQFTITQAGTYYVDLLYDGCTYTDTLQVAVAHNSLSFPDTVSICPGDSIPIPLSEDPIWINGDLQRASTFLIDKEGIYIFEQANSFCYYSDTLLAIYEAPPENPSVVIDTTLCQDDTLSIFLPHNAGSWLWEGNPISDTLQFTEAGTYPIHTSQGCFDRERIYHIREEDCRCNVAVANVLTPNGDGINDTWHIEPQGNVVDITYHIYDRWGNLVFSDRDGMQWDGISGQNCCETGVYFWEMQYQCEASAIFQTSGYIMLWKD